MTHTIYKMTFGLLVAASTAFAQVPTSGLMAYYPFNGNANDASGNGNNGTVIGATLTTDRFEKLDNAYNFNKLSNTEITIPSISEDHISLWFSANTTNDDMGFYWGGNLEVDKGFFIGIQSPNAQIGNTNTNLKPNLWSLNVGYIGNDICIPVKNIESGWHHIVIDRSDRILNIYIDNNLYPGYVWDEPVLDGPDQGTGSWSTITTQPFTLPRNPSTTPSIREIGNGFNGKIDDIRIYNRILNSNEVTDLFNERIITSIHETNEGSVANTLKVYPNPASNFLIIESNKVNVSGHSVLVTDVMGQTVFSSAINQNQLRINLDNWPNKGLYILKLVDAQNVVVEIRKVIVQ